MLINKIWRVDYMSPEFDTASISWWYTRVFFLRSTCMTRLIQCTTAPNKGPFDQIKENGVETYRSETRWCVFSSADWIMRKAINIKDIVVEILRRVPRRTYTYYQSSTMIGDLTSRWIVNRLILPFFYGAFRLCTSPFANWKLAAHWSFASLFYTRFKKKLSSHAFVPLSWGSRHWWNTHLAIAGRWLGTGSHNPLHCL